MDNGFPRCSKCQGKVLREGTRYRCLNCGQEWVSLKKRGEFYEFNKLDILKDVRSKGLKATRLKWQMPSSTLSGLIKKWEIVLAELPPVVTQEPAVNGLVKFPQFSDSWPESVMLKWLDVYEKIELIQLEVKTTHE